ncbi:sodium/hydrogen exchanger 9B1 isoform X3 [Monodelphis domestica]|uniref:sodium/hydrogen exchanger 9B1 isoform X3 n=1 Tax=Monodelphis domestica TaxID=13616 RepID=UPI0024E1D017|nr:sodium/hydrogen exchanger 9B1 isoform X3 [Monodelphis domestica]
MGSKENGIDSGIQNPKDEKKEESQLVEEKEQKFKLISFLFTERSNACITSSILLIILWGVIWSYTGHEILPGGRLFGTLAIFLCAIIGGEIVKLIKIPMVPPLPPLLGMLLAGFALRNLPGINQHINVIPVVSACLRNTALTIILVRAGLGLDPEALKKLKGVCLRLSMGPCFSEACATAIISRFTLHFPWHWGFLLGFVLGAVSPAVVVPSMLMLQDKGFGIKKGIPTLLVAASSFDDILAITGFNAFLNITFSTGPVYQTLLKGLFEAIISVIIGVTMGLFCRYFPSKDQKARHWQRAGLILGLSILAVIGSNRLGFHGSGGLTAIMLTATSGSKWSKEKAKVENIVAKAWEIFQPLLFGLVGAEVSVQNLESDIIGTCVATLSMALLVRIMVTFFLVSFTDFSIKEKIFVALSWIPKATVQAVLGPLALETTRSLNTPHLEAYAKTVMTMAFLGILITAPNGALLIGLLGPSILSKEEIVNDSSA